MKAILYLLILLNSFFAIAQSTTPALKIYLEDAYNGKNIKDAKVTIEGFEIPPITGKYNKKGKYYYFDTIPKDYNSVMAYHEKYNEKGFQGVNGLPKKIKLKLYKPYRVALNKNFYKEDNTKLLLSFNDAVFNNGDTTKSLLEKERDYVTTNFKDIKLVEITLGRFTDLILIEKVDNSAFKRFNDTTINKLLSDTNIAAIHGLILKTLDKYGTYFLKDGTPVFKPNFDFYTDAKFVIDIYNKWKNDSIRIDNINYDELNKYTIFLKKNNINGNAIKISKARKDSLFVYNNFYRFSTYQKKDSLLHYNEKILIKSGIRFRRNDGIISAKEIEDWYDPYVIIDNYANFKTLNKFYTKHKDIVIEKQLNGKKIYVFKGIYSPSGMLDLIDYYKI